MSGCFSTTRATLAVLQFLRDRKVGGVVTLPPPGGGRRGEGLEEIEFWPEEGECQGICGEEGWPGLP